MTCWVLSFSEDRSNYLNSSFTPSHHTYSQKLNLKSKLDEMFYGLIGTPTAPMRTFVSMRIFPLRLLFSQSCPEQLIKCIITTFFNNSNTTIIIIINKSLKNGTHPPPFQSDLILPSGETVKTVSC